MVDPRKIKFIAFDADDTLWHNESLFTLTQDKFKQLLLPYHTEEWIGQKLYETETRNIEHFGYGVKGFTLSMIETAIELSEGRIGGDEIAQIIGFSKEMLRSPVEVFDGVEETIQRLSQTHRLLIITKGDLFDQESKIARSGLDRYFSHVEVVATKTAETYEKILSRQNIPRENFMMVGNSLKSDVLPVTMLGGTAVHIPYATTWAHEEVGAEELDGHDFIRLEDIRDLTGLLVGDE
ncbi:MAG: HAD family hydrolase [Pyrinomonadaceae bacterium]